MVAVIAASTAALRSPMIADNTTTTHQQQREVRVVDLGAKRHQYQRNREHPQPTDDIAERLAIVDAWAL